ncbi:PREDICTED: uncharacterized protein LOC100631573 [Amphimedon queenslandica]|uniref:DUF1758 domain-containing protein n=1 Tax=Amphimedon queenslandica TaxID=400682 RepID=A0AAN0IMR5_AMPQE|nr:PREDICTED: uncharacterized protein LOC100631573 [Amphimedon queenslandica]|eukprot:XP_011404369.1 PREDICTED: uncharacterized protein LOC100631573 [Amphimedon queenslandica]
MLRELYCYRLRRRLCTTQSTERATLRLVFNSGSHRSYITEEVCHKLSLRILGKKDLVIATFGNTGKRRQSCKIAQAVLETNDGNTLVLNLMVFPLICEPLVGVSLRDCIRGYDHLKDLDLADPGTNGDVIKLDILIGLDYYWDIVSGEVLRGDSGPTATYLSLGWLLSGPVASDSTTLVTYLQKFWEIESLGICEKESTLYDQFKKNVTFDGTRYEVTLPWREDVSSIPDNYQLSLKRLNGLLRRLRKNPTLLEKHNKAIVTQLDSGIVEVVENPTRTDIERVHNLPHHCVVRGDKETTKLRIVYDASTRSTGPSLNECLYVEPKFNQIIMELLVKFRVHKCAFIADIEKAFLMISVGKQDRDVLKLFG